MLQTFLTFSLTTPFLFNFIFFGSSSSFFSFFNFHFLYLLLDFIFLCKYKQYINNSYIFCSKTTQYDNAMTGMATKLLKRTSRSNLAYVSDWDGGRNVHKMDHLVCFLPGILALGAYSKPDSPNRDRDMMLAKSLMYTCYQMYKRTKTGIAAEYYEMPGGGDPQPATRAPFYILRPETAESLFVLNQLTGNPIYRDWSWDMFSAIEKYCKTQYGYGAWPDVRQTGRRPDDRMESFWLGETLKYFYLIHVPMEEHGIDLTKYVFNTEAHPTRTLPEVRKAIAEAKARL